MRTTAAKIDAMQTGKELYAKTATFKAATS